jgi:hypothetical protein
VKNYICHWTFLIEIIIVFSALAVFLRVKETVVYLTHLLVKNRKLRFIFFRLCVCVLSLSVIAVVISFRFNVDKRLVHKMIQIKHAVVRWVIS